MSEKFLFLKSIRFWKMVIVGILIALEQQGVITGDLSKAVANVLELVLTGSVVIRTVDRFGEKLANNT